MLNEGENMPVAVADDIPAASVTVPLPAGARLLIVSDGMVEQPAPQNDACDPPLQFGTGGVAALAPFLLMSRSPVADLFAAVICHAGSPDLADDATCVFVTP
jgi:hypothetical protein